MPQKYPCGKSGHARLSAEWLALRLRVFFWAQRPEAWACAAGALALACAFHWAMKTAIAARPNEAAQLWLAWKEAPLWGFSAGAAAVGFGPAFWRAGRGKGLRDPRKQRVESAIAIARGEALARGQAQEISAALGPTAPSAAQEGRASAGAGRSPRRL